MTTCIQPKCATGPGNANTPLLKYVGGLLGSGPREATEVLGASERGKGWWGGGKWGLVHGKEGAPGRQPPGCERQGELPSELVSQLPKASGLTRSEGHMPRHQPPT